MARRNFITEGTIPAAVAALNGDQQSRLGYAVSRYAPAGNTQFLADNAGDLVTDHPTEATLTGNTVLITGAIEVENSYVFVNRTVVFNSAGSRMFMGLNGNHVYFVNCYIVIQQEVAPVGGTQVIGAFENHNAQGTGPTQRNRPLGIALGINGSATINSYGCTVDNQAQSLAYVSFSDSINTDLISTRSAGTRLIAPPNGGRWLNYSIRNAYDTAVRIQPYGVPAVFENVVLDNTEIRTGQDIDNSSELLDRPIFPSARQGAYFDANVAAGTVAARRFQPAQLFGGPGFGTVADAVGALDTAGGTNTQANGQLRGGLITLDVNRTRLQGGFHNYTADARSYQYIDNTGATVAAQGIRTQFTVNVSGGNISARGGTANWVGNGALATPDTSGHTFTCAALTNAQGLHASDYYQSSAGTRQTGYIDWLRFHPDITVGSGTFGENPHGVVAPLGLFFVPFEKVFIGPGETDLEYSDISAPQFTVTRERRAYAFDVADGRDVNGNLINLPHPAARENIDIPAGEVTLPYLVGTTVKTELTNAAQEFAIADAAVHLAADQPVSINDIRNAFRNHWAEYLTNNTPDSRININLDTSGPTDAIVFNDASTVTVRGNALARSPGDLFFNDANLRLVNLRGGAIDGLTLGDTNTQFTNILTSDSVAGISNATLAGTYNVTADRDLFVGPGNDLSGLTLSADAGATLTVRGATAADFAGTAGAGDVVFEIAPPSITFPLAGNYWLGRIRGGAYSTVTIGTPVAVTAGQVVALSTADYNTTDEVVVYYRPTDATTGNANRYNVTRQTFIFNAGDQNIRESEIVPELLDGVDGAFAPTSSTFTRQIVAAPGVNYLELEMDNPTSLDLPATKEFALWLTSQPDYLTFLGNTNIVNNLVGIGARGVSFDASRLVFTRDAGTTRSEFTGISVGTGQQIQQGTSTDPNVYLITAAAGGNVGFISSVVPAGITVAEVRTAIDSSTTATQVTTISGNVDRIDARVQVMRGDSLLGIRPQSADTETGPN